MIIRHENNSFRSCLKIWAKYSPAKILRILYKAFVIHGIPLTSLTIASTVLCLKIAVQDINKALANSYGTYI